MVAHDTLKADRGPVLRMFDFREHRLGINALSHDGHVFSARCSATHRRQQRDLIVFLQPDVYPGVFLIHRDSERWQHLPQSWHP